ncbi:efflux transporter outer membrane subunit [Paenimyroides aestuarii]|uniref:TolC family protein n=1 Tax=Paenimyroides aestuarii TaxID=2968490 RepID=A0ABY5NVS2_9FLAO|nr:TolC family protein [Paenimyroides aestuarii]UUV22687.1 TolC family protein [Paenimyroides aestuarii]
MKIIYKTTFVAITAVLLQSCIATKEYQKPEVWNNASFNTNEVVKDSAAESVVPWQQVFTDALLQQHIQTALENNLDIRVALENINQAQSYLSQGRMGYMPTFTIGTNYTHSVNSINTQFGRILGQRQRLDQFDITGSLGWEADIWGKITSKKLAAEATYLQTVSAHKAVKTQLIAMVASTYYNLLALDAQKQVALQTIENRNKSLETNKALKDAGRVTEVAVKQTEAQALSAQALLLDIENNIKQQENSLSILKGMFPHAIERAAFSDLQLNVNITEGVSIQTLNNRPDVVAAELGFRNAFELTNVAKASFYPTLKLTASGGLQSVEFEKLFDPTSFFASIVAGIAQPVLNGRQIRTQYEISLSNQEKAFLNYKQTVLDASKEISDALYAIDINNKKLVLKQKEAEAYSTAVNYSQELLNNGLASYLEVLTATESELNAQLNIITTQYNLWNANIQLYKAMGGGVE